MRCPHCNNHVLQKSGARTRLRTEGPLTFEDGVCRAKCYWCKGDIEIPLEIKEGTPIATEKFVLSRRG